MAASLTAFIKFLLFISGIGNNGNSDESNSCLQQKISIRYNYLNICYLTNI
jgi:DNA replication protein DnaC